MAPPERWEAYTNMGRRVPGTRFICFKVPLRGNDTFSLRDLTDHCTELGMIIDLTNTTKYYNPKVLDAQNIAYKKIFTMGRVLPKVAVVKEFIDAVNEFLGNNANNDKLVGVHCTHGVNRTGYLVCRYMIQLLDVPPDQAIADFDSARGHVQERQLYLDDLRRAQWIDEDPALYGKQKKRLNKSRKRAKMELKALHNTPNRKLTKSDTNIYADNHEENDDDEDERDSDDANDTTNGDDNDDSYSTVNSSLTTGSGGRRRYTHKTSSGMRFIDDESPTSVAQRYDEDSTPRGTKRSYSAHRGPWMPPCRGGPTDADDDAVSHEHKRLRFKRSAPDHRYGDASQQRYDRYFYQQRDGGGPDRTDRELYGHNDMAAKETKNELRKYKGPNKRYRSPARKDKLDDSGSAVRFDDHEPLSFPDDQSPRKGFLEETPQASSKKRSKSPNDEPSLFSPEGATPGSSKQRRRSKMRYEPY